MPKTDFFFVKSSQAPGGNLTVRRYFKCFVFEFMGGASVHRAVLSLCVRVCVRAGGVHGDVGGANDDSSSLLLLGAGSPLLSAFNVLNGLRRNDKRLRFCGLTSKKVALGLLMNDASKQKQNQL